MPLHGWDPEAEVSASLCNNPHLPVHVIPFMRCSGTNGPKLSKFCTQVALLTPQTQLLRFLGLRNFTVPQ